MSTTKSTTSTSADAPSLAAQMRPALLKYFRRKTRSAAEAEDLTQDVLVRALTHANWQSPDQAKGYIFRIAVNCWHDRQRRLRAQRHEVAHDELEIEQAGVERPPETVLVIREQLIQVVRALEAMSERTRAVLMLIKLEQMRAAAVAEMLGISESAVNKHLAKGLARLAELRKHQDRT
jgi:RNA polymerase sigma factor (sigma-70 family)